MKQTKNEKSKDKNPYIKPKIKTKSTKKKKENNTKR